MIHVRCAVMVSVLLGATPPARKPLSPSPERATRNLVDVNRASLQELRRLPGITEPLAVRILQARPYQTKAQLVTRKVLPLACYETLKKHIRARQPGEPE